MAMLRAQVICALLLVSWLVQTHAYTVTVGANAEECFFETIDRGQKVVGSFNVAAGGFLDIDVKVC